MANTVALAKAADESRGLAIDSISKAQSGHMGLPLGCAEIGAVLFGQELSSRQRAHRIGHPKCFDSRALKHASSTMSILFSVLRALLGSRSGR